MTSSSSGNVCLHLLSKINYWILIYQKILFLHGLTLASLRFSLIILLKFLVVFYSKIRQFLYKVKLQLEPWRQV